ncbi:MAG: LysR family transcriptional regulator [Phycisphaerae bacterium]|nr:MAG: LysR family transcriptional regulator [Phycisphaerae bacterium]
MELTTLRQFREIARAGHMTRAAAALGVTQPALSASVRKLEAEVGATLLHRSRRGVELTEAGRVFLAHAEDALRAAVAAARAVREVVGLEAGSIRIGGGATATAYLLPRVIGAVRRAHPGLRFYIREAGSAAVAAAVASGELDLGIVTLPVVGAAAEALVRVPLVTDELRLIVPPNHALAGKASFRWSDVAGEALVAFEAGTAVRDMIDRAAARAGITMRVVMELRSIESITRMVAAGIGVGFVSRFAVDETRGLSCRDGRLKRELAIVRRRDRAETPAVMAVERELLRAVRGRRVGDATPSG